MSLQAALIFIHLLMVVIWVGGMFFAHMVLRPTALEVLEPPLRLPLWRGVFRRFFPWVWGAVILIPLTGALLFAQVGFKAAPLSWHVMMLTGGLMVLIFAYLFLVPYGSFRRGVDARNWPAAGAALNRMRQLVATNLTLGLLTVAIATLGKAL